MLRNYFKFSWRRLLTDKKTTFIHLAGLAIGIAGFLLIVQYVMYERSYDSFFENKDRIYRVGLEVYRDNKLSIRSAINYAGVGPALKSDYNEVEQFFSLPFNCYPVKLLIVFKDCLSLFCLSKKVTKKGPRQKITSLLSDGSLIRL